MNELLVSLVGTEALAKECQRGQHAIEAIEDRGATESEKAEIERFRAIVGRVVLEGHASVRDLSEPQDFPQLIAEMQEPPEATGGELAQA